jgi:hypothetical protein
MSEDMSSGDVQGRAPEKSACSVQEASPPAHPSLKQIVERYFGGDTFLSSQCRKACEEARNAGWDEGIKYVESLRGHLAELRRQLDEARKTIHERSIDSIANADRFRQKLQQAEAEIERLRLLLRSVPRSLGILESEIEHHKIKAEDTPA